MIKSALKVYGFLFLFIPLALSPLLSHTEKELDLKLNKVLEIGRKDLMFASITSVCEDDGSNFYVLDKKEHKVFKFSKDGKLILYFGRKGQGPGDFQQPNQITYSLKGQIVVADDLFNVSFLNADGTFINRIHLDGRLGLGYIGEELFYSWIWRPEDKRQVVVDSENNVVNTFFKISRGSFSVSVPDSSGRLVMFNYAPDEYAPSLLFAHSGRYSAVGVSDRYEILILNEKGETVSTVQREILPGNISKKGKQYFVKDIYEIGKRRGWPKSVIRKIVKIIPGEKNYFDCVLLSKQHVFVFRIREDVSDEEAPVLVDVFTLEGKFQGTARVKIKPIFASEKFMYFVESDEEDNLFLVKMSYKIRS